MIERPDEIIEGAKILLSILGIKECYIGIEANKGDAIKILRKSVESKGLNGLKIRINPLKVK
jgi:electron transport complex protein RnfC